MHGSARPAPSPSTSGTATIWTASQGTHGNQTTFARFIGLPKDKVRLIYLEGSGCYGMNGHEDAAADAAILSRAKDVQCACSGRARTNWAGSEGPPQLIDISGAVASDGRILDGGPNCDSRDDSRPDEIPLLAPEAAGLDHVPGLNAGLISQNGVRLMPLRASR